MFDTEIFISEVEKRPALYDLSLKDYTNRDVKLQLWDEIGREMYANWDELDYEEKSKLGKELQIKWKSIRDHFRREVILENKVKTGQSARKKKKYVFYDQLQFLKNYLENKSGSTIKVEETQLQEPDSAQTGSITTARRNPTRGKLVRRTHNHNDSAEIEDVASVLSQSMAVAVPRQEIEEDVMGNKLFLLSLLPLMSNMPQNTVIELRFKIMELFNMYCNQQTEDIPDLYP